MKISEFLHESVYPSLYENVIDAFPEFGFKYTGYGYKSTTGQKVDGSNGEKGKVYLYNNNLSNFIDYTRGSLSVWNYLQNRDNLSNRETLVLLCSLALVPLPSNLSSENLQELEYQSKVAQLLEDCNDFFIDSLSQKDNVYANSDAASQVRTYIEKTRKYNPVLLRLPGSKEIENHYLMELGYMPSAHDTFNYLIEKKKHPEDFVYDHIKIPSLGMDTHKLTIPFREPSGRIRGFIFRTTQSDLASNQPKYLYSPGIKKDDLLFNQSAVKGNKDLIIVEGIFDCLHATAKNIPNVVALGSASLNARQLKNAIKNGAQTITLCLDNDTTGRESTLRCLKLITQESDLKCFIVQLPHQVKDPDELISNYGIGAFKEALEYAVPHYIYMLEVLFADAIDQSKINFKELDKIQQTATEIAANIKDPIGRDIFENKFIEKLQFLGITKDSLKSIIDKLKWERQQEINRIEIQNVLNEAKDKNQSDNPTNTVSYIEQRLQQIKYNVQNSVLENLLETITEDDVRKKLSTQPDSLRTGLYFRDKFSTQEELMLPSGALSIVAARTSHGKTAFLMNIALQVATYYPEKSVYFFSLEEDKEAILIKMLNIYINKELKPGIKNLKYIKNYFKGLGNTYQNIDFLRGKDEFFNDYLLSGRLHIHYAFSDIDELITAVRYLKDKKNVCAVFIDYIQLLTIKQQYQTRQLELQAICNKLLKEMAVPSGLPIILGAQFNREVLEEGMLDATKIREAGDIEQTANLIIGLWNRGFTLEKKQRDRRNQEAKHNPNEIYAEILKNRDGQAGMIAELEFNGATGRISNYEYGVPK
ncbi:MAG: DnaB-like helicase C-terminal domain-containing protein [Bacteroidota bacterium]|nr:DnaB-like helicase C-terminal domain-containing protein [Bacteroidota bacterium]